MSGTQPIRILYVGDLIWWGTCLQRCRALEELGCIVESLNIYQNVDMKRQISILPRVMRKLGLPLDLASVNHAIVTALQKTPFDILWFDKALLIRPDTLRAAKRLQPACKIVGYSPDDMYGKHNQSRYFLQHLPLYDIFFTTKSYGVEELKKMGCKQPVFLSLIHISEPTRPY